MAGGLPGRLWRTTGRRDGETLVHPVQILSVFCCSRLACTHSATDCCLGQVVPKARTHTLPSLQHVNQFSFLVTCVMVSGFGVVLRFFLSLRVVLLSPLVLLGWCCLLPPSWSGAAFPPPFFWWCWLSSLSQMTNDLTVVVSVDPYLQITIITHETNVNMFPIVLLARGLSACGCVFACFCPSYVALHLAPNWAPFWAQIWLPFLLHLWLPFKLPVRFPFGIPSFPLEEGERDGLGFISSAG